ncbi:MAG TPA: MBL fold metallo-hydrolase [Acidimicrobiales bacterium]|nr:MBL fold metallo-hydrolase [Acidimicrobiales bacterium]
MSGFIAPGVFEIDTLLGGWERVTAGYLLAGEAPVLVETGSQSSVPVLLAALAQFGLAEADLAGVVLSHIHLDHAGGVGDVARAFPRATVYVHPKGARHLADPSRLIASAATVYGPALDSLYGRMSPVPEARIRAVDHGEKIDLGGGRTLTALHSPGHAKHHIALHDSESGVLFVGDAAGVKLPGPTALRPATPPADFDLDLALQSLRLFASRDPSRLALAHYGLLPEGPREALEEAGGALREWASVAEAAWASGEDVEHALRARFASELDALTADDRERLEALNGLHSNAEGLKLWLSRVRGARGEVGGQVST